jgi:hypothetical protein
MVDDAPDNFVVVTEPLGATYRIRGYVEPAGGV